VKRRATEASEGVGHKKTRSNRSTERGGQGLIEPPLFFLNGHLMENKGPSIMDAENLESCT